MKAVVFRGVGDIRLEDVRQPKLKDPTDAIVRLTASAICGTDLHFVRGTLSGVKPGTVLGHEGVGVVEEIGKDVRNLKEGDRVVVPSTIACGSCVYCRAGYYSQCDKANPNGPASGTAFYGGPKSSGPFDGMQAEFVRVPFANVNLVKLPDEISDDQAILLSDIFPTGYMGAEMAEIDPGDTVAVFGCGPVGQFAIASARLLGAGRIIAIDRHPSRLEMARNQGAEVINFDEDDPVKTIQRLTDKTGVDRAIDAVGVDAEKPGKKSEELWQPGNAPSQVLDWAIEALAKAGTLSIIGVYDEETKFSIGNAMEKNLTIQMGNCHHRKYIPQLIPIVQQGVFDPSTILTQSVPMTSVIEAYENFDLRKEGWIKVMVQPAAGAKQSRMAAKDVRLRSKTKRASAPKRRPSKN